MNIACPGLTHGLLSTSCSIIFCLLYNLPCPCLLSSTTFLGTWTPFSEITQNTCLWFKNGIRSMTWRIVWSKLLRILKIVMKLYVLGHPCALHILCSAWPPSQAAPPNWAGTFTWRCLTCVPPPHVLVQVVQELNSSHEQSTRKDKNEIHQLRWKTHN